ncbi:tumor necrosis factor alpha-induced protein 3-like isoform X2 [Narcine bancroftii]|uniref:tumor necrosis factor alpha-induced protein 3-like isoform X2 n=1 Tax=Narcine bancroftii TaxID=1343680 RepID=UPI0038320FD6
MKIWIHSWMMIWDQEWENVIECADPASAASRAVTNIYQDVHFFVLANIIRRPIIVIAGNSEEGLKSSSSKTSSPAGIYLPLHWPPLQCCTCPVLLSYEHRYFTPLISINDIGPEINAFPLVVPDRTGSVELPIRFLLEAEKVNRKQLLSNYLIEISVPDCHGVEFINAARLLINPLPDDLNLVLDYFQLVNHRYKSWQESSGNVTNNRNGKKVDFLSPLSIVEDKCLTHGCPYFCSKFTKPFCHMCHDAFQSNKESSESKTGKQGDCRQVGKHFNKERSTSFEPQDVSDHQSKSGISFFSETNALKCKLAECPFTGSETLHGFCASCFHKLGHLDLIPEKGRNSDLAVPGEILDERLDIFRERCSKCEQEGRKCNGLCDLTANALTLMRGTADQASSELQQAGLGIVDSGQGQDLQGGRVRESKQCKNPSCQFFGTEEQSGLCTTCFFKHVEGLGVFSQRDSDQGHSEHSPSPPQRKCSQISSHLREMTVCRSSDCSMLANPAYSGHCQKCYVKQLYSVPLAGHCPEEHHIWDPLLPRCSNGNAANSQRSSDQTTREPFVLEQEGSGNTSCLVQNSQTRILPASDQLNLKPQKHICRSEGCEHFGNTKCDGYCNACFTSSPTHSK